MGTVLGFDAGTASSKGVLVETGGRIVATATRSHSVARPDPSRVEMDAEIWWSEFCDTAAQLVGRAGATVEAIGLSGMGPCVALVDAAGAPVAPAALYGVDLRAVEQIDALNQELGQEAIFARTDSRLTTQAGGPKLRWFAERMPDAFSRAARFHTPASLLVERLTGEYVMDRQSASQMTPLYDAQTQEWADGWWERVAGHIERPRLAWAGDLAGVLSSAAAAATGLPVGTPVTVGTIDAWAEGVSVGAVRDGDLLLMYGTTMFMISNASRRLRHPAMWGTTGIRPGQWNLAGGMATSGAVTDWLRELFGVPGFSTLVAEAESSGPGARGLLMLPYFSGERTPIQDPLARGVVCGLTLSHTRGDVYRAALEATAYGVRHNLEAMADAGVQPARVVAVGGGATTSLWPQIVTDVTGLTQVIPTHTIGAAFGDAWLAAGLLGAGGRIDDWNPPARLLTPNDGSDYDELYRWYRQLHESTREIQHGLARRGRAPIAAAR
ncbi:FGGY-family carbohydrate kinase [Pedococcus sp. 2YAF34]|uniref:FGGY-family carbohydrate kinase n=1 Tax=Pedococcus sp. 2YAF34 TaxID=3233032 RepID=UPI003F94C4B2